jgi:signal transduction histidine kinase/CheY-like chemotaxis protein
MKKLNFTITVFLLILCSNTFGQVSHGYIDLKESEVALDVSLFLKGDWLFAPNKLLKNASEIDSSELITIEVPMKWGQVGLPSQGFGTYLLKMERDTSSLLSLKIPDVLSAYALYINGVLIKKVGKVGMDESTTLPERKTTYFNISQELGKTLNVCLQIANFSHARGGLGSIPIISSTRKIYRQKLYEDTYDVFLFGCLIMGSLFFFGLYVSGRKEKMAIYFALFCMTYAYRVVGWGNYLLHDIVDMPYRLGLVLEYLSLYLSVFFFAKYLGHLFPKEAPKKIINFFAYIALACTATTVLPVQIFTGLINYFLGLLVVVMVFVSVVFIKAAINRRQGANLAIYSTFGIFFIFTLKTLIFFRLVNDILYVNLIGELTFFFFQSLILSRYFMNDWRNAKMEAEQIAKSKADFLSVMSHEIRTPLNALIGTTYHMLDAKPRVDQMKDLSNLKNASENLLNLVNNILDFNKLEQNKLELEHDDVELESYITNQVNLFQSITEAKGIYLKLNYDNFLPSHVMVDKGRLGQILNNLIGNAIKFTIAGGVTVNVRSEGYSKEAINITFDIIDTGIGIENEHKEKIFESFVQANAKIAGEYGGTGLGLAISKRLLERMNSEIVVKSVEGQGSLFSFSLCLEPIVPKVFKEIPHASRKLAGCRLLLVEDNSMNIVIANRFLEKWNVDVTIAKNGQKAVELVFDGQHDFDIILMDLQMPILNGYQAAAAIRKIGFSKPILAVTASAVTESDLEANGGYMQDFITKPYRPDDLFDKIKKYCFIKQEASIQT